MIVKIILFLFLGEHTNSNSLHIFQLSTIILIHFAKRGTSDDLWDAFLPLAEKFRMIGFSYQFSRKCQHREL